MKNKVSILRQTKRIMVRAMCGMELMDKKYSNEILGLRRTEINLTKASRVQWYGDVLSRDEGDAL